MAVAMGISAQSPKNKNTPNPNTGLQDIKISSHLPAYDKTVYFFNYRGQFPRKRRYNNGAYNSNNFVPAGTDARVGF